MKIWIDELKNKTIAIEYLFVIFLTLNLFLCYFCRKYISYGYAKNKN